MADRLDLQTTFEDILGSRNVYFQPPTSVQIKYPAIVYSLSDYESRFANNVAYSRAPGYEITLMDTNPDSEFIDQILQLPYCRFDRFFVSDNLNHWVFKLFNN